MAIEKVKCPGCNGEKVSKFGKSSSGVPRYVCKDETCKTWTFSVEYKSKACIPGVKDTIVRLAMNGCGIRATARAIGVSTWTVTQTLKKNLKD